MKNIADLTAAEAIEKLKAPEVGPGLTRDGLIMHLYIIAMSFVIAGDEKSAEAKNSAFEFLLDLLKNGSLDDKVKIRACLNR